MAPLPRADLAHALERAEPAWHALRGARLFITGGTGFFGTWLLEAIAAANAAMRTRITATVLSRDPGAFRARAPALAASDFFDWHAGDVREFAFPQGAYSHILHAATTSRAWFNSSEPEDMFASIVDGTRRVLAFARERKVPELLYVSSGAVYGPQPPSLERMPETWNGAPDCLDPANAYAEGKRAAELLCAAAARGGPLRPRIARCFAFVGPLLPLREHFAVGNFLGDLLEGRDITINGDGSPLRSYLHAADLVAWLVTILTRGAPLRPYNVGSDHAVSIAELARHVARLKSPAVRVHVKGTPGKEPAQRYVPSIDRARGELGLDAWLDLEAALERTFAWLRL